MKITFVALNYAPSRGGAQEHVRQIAEGLVERGHEVTVLTTDFLRSPAAHRPVRVRSAPDVLGGVVVVRHGTPRLILSLLSQVRGLAAWYSRRTGQHPARPSPWLLGPWSPSLMIAVRRALRTDDVVVGCSVPFTTAVLPNWLRRRRRGGARVASMPLLHASDRGPHPAIGRALRTSELVFASTTFEAGLYGALGVPAELVTVIPPGVEPGDFLALTPAEARARCGLPERPTVGFIGRIAAYKGVDTFLEAAPAIWADAPDTTVLIAGSETGWNGLQTSGVLTEEEDRVVVRKEFDDAERPLLYAACDVVVHPSRDESFGLVALESWAAGRPIVLADIPSVCTFAEDDRNAAIVPPGDAPELARRVVALLADPATRERLALAGQANLVGRFDWKHICDRWDEAFHGLVEVER